MLEIPPTNDRLDSWKEIAAYLKRNERTVSRWEKRGLPVYRVPGAQRQMIFAFKHELDAWLKRGKNGHPDHEPKESNTAQKSVPPLLGEAISTQPKPPSRLRYLIGFGVLGTLILAAACIAFLSFASPGAFPTRMGFTTN